MAEPVGIIKSMLTVVIGKHLAVAVDKKLEYNKDVLFAENVGWKSKVLFKATQLFMSKEWRLQIIDANVCQPSECSWGTSCGLSVSS